jgi:CIC family chloride channel protein
MILGMAGFFAAAAKTPFSTLIIVTEMTDNFQLLLPGIWVVTIAYLLSDEQSLFHSQVASRSLSPAHQGSYVREVLAGLRIRQFLKTEGALPLLHPDDPLTTVLDRFDTSQYPVLPVVDDEGRLLGVVNLEEVHFASRSSHLGAWLMATDLMRTVTPLAPELGLDRAQELFIENDVLALPVIDGEKGRVVGIVRRSDVAQTYLRRVHGLSKEEAPVMEAKAEAPVEYQGPEGL